MKLKAAQSGSLLEILSALFPESSKRALRLWVKTGRITLGGQPVLNVNHLLSEGDLFNFEDKVKSTEEGIQIIYEDRDLVVIQKPAGVLSVATVFEKAETVHDILKRRYYRQRVFPVHRLDRETSGVMVFAYSAAAREGLKEQFQLHTIEREYLALVEGDMQEKKGIWESFLKEDANYYVSSHPKGKKAVTHFEVIKNGPTYSALKLRLQTGRKNQVRVHASEAGYPIVGDLKYGANLNPVNRLGLHAHYLAFIHPVTKKRLAFKSPVPPPLKKYFKGMQ